MNLWFGQDSDITSPYNDSGRYYSFLPTVYFNLTTLPNISAKIVISNQVTFVIFFWGGVKTCSEESYVDKTKLFITKISENFILLFSRKPVTVRIIFITESRLFALKVKFMSTKINVKILNVISSLVCVLYRTEKRSVRIFDKYIYTLFSMIIAREPINLRSLPLWKNERIGNERALIGESLCWSKIHRGLVGHALKGRGERDQIFNRLKNSRGWSHSPQVVCWAGVQRGGRRYSVGWSYFDRLWSAIQRK